MLLMFIQTNCVLQTNDMILLMPPRRLILNKCNVHPKAKNIRTSSRIKDKVGVFLDWMITEDMKHTEHYRMYAEVFGLDVSLTQSQPTESTQGMHRTPSAPRSPTPKMETVTPPKSGRSGK
ncbi:hypothetical protein Tco_0437557, partial [Tanacetum coccineum]